MTAWIPSLGAIVEPHGVRFRVWAPRPQLVELVIEGPHEARSIPMEPASGGDREAFVPGLAGGVRYRYRLDGQGPYPDPVSRGQPDGVHGVSQVVDPAAFPWTDHGWKPPGRENLTIYECHIGTLTSAGTFDAAIDELERIAGLGFSALEVMPVASFPGRRNWGYDGVSLFAPSATYGGPEGMRRFIDAAHATGLAVILDVVYNHFGPDGNYTGLYSATYQTHRHQTPWGDAMNFDDTGSEGVREFVIENLLHWVHEYHVDGFRFDATHAIHDDSNEHILAEVRRRLSEHRRNGHDPYLIAETPENDRRYLLSLDNSGFGFDAVWADDFHNVSRNIMHQEREGYLRSFAGTVDELAHVVSRGWLFEGQTDPVNGESRGTSPDGIPWRKFVYCLQNHDQVGNRAFGERANLTANPATLLAETVLLLLIPQTPLVFQGEEYMATTPFLYFTDHNPELGRLVTEGRRREFAGFAAFSDPETRERIPDPQAESTFLASKLQAVDRERPAGRQALAFHRELLRLRKDDPVLCLARTGRDSIHAEVNGQALLIRLENEAGVRDIAVNFGESAAIFSSPTSETVLDSHEPRFGGGTLSVAGTGTLRVAPHSGVLAR